MYWIDPIIECIRGTVVITPFHAFFIYCCQMYYCGTNQVKSSINLDYRLITQSNRTRRAAWDSSLNLLVTEPESYVGVFSAGDRWNVDFG